jgi:hypothetical protein
MDVVDRAQAVLPPEKYAKKALFCLDRQNPLRKFCIALTENPRFDAFVMVLIILNTLWMLFVTDPIITAKLEDDEIAGRTGGPGAATYEEVMAQGGAYDPSEVKMMGREFAAERHHWAPIYRPFYDGCQLGKLPPCSGSDTVELIFLLFFTLEMMVKIIAEGFLMHKNAYMRSAWNLLDFLVVVTGWVALFVDGANLSALRALKPLRSVKRVRKLRILVQCIIAALPALGSIAVILIFVCVTLGIIGTQLFQASTRHACYDCVGGQWVGDECVGGEMENSGDICSPMCLRDMEMIGLQENVGCTGKEDGCGPVEYAYCSSLGNMTKGEYRVYGPDFGPSYNHYAILAKGTGADGRGLDPYLRDFSAYSSDPPVGWWTCRPHQQCRCGESGDINPNCTVLDNPNYGANTFDNTLMASLTMFQAITLEGWVDAMYTIIDGSGVFAFIYFVVAVLFGACIILNLFLAVLCDNFAIAEDDPTEGDKEEEEDGEAELQEAAKSLNHTSAFRNWCLKIAESQRFMWFITGCILLNALLMMLMVDPDAEALGGALSAHMPERTNYQPPGMFYTLWFLNALLTLIFTFESVVKLIGLGWTIFRMDSFNNFDLVVVLFSLVDVAMDVAGVYAGAEIPSFFPVSVLRTFRIIRVLKLARSYENLRTILSTLVKSVKSVAYLCILMLLFILIFALLGMGSFGAKYPRPEYNFTEEYYPDYFRKHKIGPNNGGTWSDDGPTRYNFDSFGEAFLSIFVILSGENWNEIWWDAHRATTPAVMSPIRSQGSPVIAHSGDHMGLYTPFPPDSPPPPPPPPNGLGMTGVGRVGEVVPDATIFFFALFISGNLIMFNLFIAILLSNFDEDEDADDGAEEEEEEEDGGLDAVTGGEKIVGTGGQKDMPMMTYTFGGYRAPQEAEMRKSGHLKMTGEPPVGGDEVEEKPKRKSQMPEADETSGDKSCMLFSWANPVRRGAAFVVWHPWFDPVIIVLIVVSSVLLAIDDPRLSLSCPDESNEAQRMYRYTANIKDVDEADQPGRVLFEGDNRVYCKVSGLKVFIRDFNYFFTAAFLVEMLMKIIVLGFIFSKNKDIPAYLRSGWNQLDFCVVIISILTLMSANVPALKVVSSLKALRTFRALRPLRLISRLEGMKQVINTLIKSIPSVGTLGIVALLFFGIFDIIGMQLFAGKLGACLDPDGVYRDMETQPTITTTMRSYDGDLYIPGFECVEKGSCTYVQNGELPPKDLYERAVLSDLVAYEEANPDLRVGNGGRSSVYYIGFDGGLKPSEICTCPHDVPTSECGNRVPCWQKPTSAVTLTMLDLDKDGIINDYEECMSMPKYNLSRYNSVGQQLHLLPKDATYRGTAVWESGSVEWPPELFYEFPQWVHPNFGNFDNFGMGFLLLFEVAALEGWPDVMFWVADSDYYKMFVEPTRTEMLQFDMIKSEDDGTRYWGPANHKANTWPPFFYGPFFFVAWILLGSFVILNMVIGVVLDAYNRIKSEGSGTAFMTDSQSEWVQTQRSIIAMRPLKSANPPPEPWRMWAYKLVTWNIFDLVIMGVIVSNMIFMTIDFYEPMLPSMGVIRMVLATANYIFLGIYIIEMMLKMLGLGFKQYFKDPWNKFDFVLVMLSIVDVVLSSSSDGETPFPASVVRVLRLFRVVRILRIFKTAKSLRAILMTIILSMPALYNVAMLLFLFIFIFACFCVSFFFSVSYTEIEVALAHSSSSDEPGYWFSTTTNYGDFINRHANFETFGMAILTLIRCVTGESFNGIMHDTMNPNWGDNMLRCCPTCGFVVDGIPTSSCGQSGASVMIFVLYCVLMSFVILALIIGVILDNFANVGSEKLMVTLEHIEEFREIWLRYDPKGTFVVPSHNLLAILQQLRKPLGIADLQPSFTRAQMLQYLGELDIPDHGGQIHFLEALTALSHKVAGVPLPLCDATKGLQKAAQKVPKLSALEKPAHNALTNYLVSLLQSRWRGYAMRKKYSDHTLGDAPTDVAQKPPGVDGAGKVKPNQVAPMP